MEDRIEALFSQARAPGQPAGAEAAIAAPQRGSWPQVTAHRTSDDRPGRQRPAVESTAIGIAIIDARHPDRPIVHCNPALELISGYSADEVLEMTWRFLAGADSTPDAYRAMRAAIAAGSECSVPIKGRRKTGALYCGVLVLSPVRDPSGVLTHYVALVSEETAHEAESPAEQEACLRSGERHGFGRRTAPPRYLCAQASAPAFAGWASLQRP